MKRFALVLALVVALAGVVVTAASALRFDDATPCPATGAIFICPSGTVGQPYSVQLVVHGGCEPYWTFKVLNGALPAGLTLSSSGLISGTPTTAGLADFWLEVADIPASQGGPSWCTVAKAAQREFKLTIDPRVIVTTSSAPPGTVGTTYNLPLQAQMTSGPGQLSPPSSPLTWSFTGVLPPGLTLDSSTGVLSGTPTTAGSYLATFKAALADGRSDTKALQIVIRDPVVITPVPLKWAGKYGSEIGIPIDATLSASGGTGTFTWALAGGSLPTGLTLGPDGTISGTPRVAGKFAFTAQVTDTEQRTASINLTVSVAPKIAFKTLTLRNAKVGKLYKATLKTTGGATPVKWKILRGTLPRGVHFAKKSGVFVGTPKRQGTYRVTVQAIDAYGVKTQKTFVLAVTG